MNPQEIFNRSKYYEHLHFPLEYNENETELETLRIIALSHRLLLKIENIDIFINVKKLFLNTNYISKIEGLENLINLKVLYLSYNQITKIEGLENLINLKELYLRCNQLTKIEGLENLINLERLCIDSNRITKIEGLENLINLEILDLRYNQITKIEGLENLINLERLLLYNNKITEINYVNFPYNVKELICDENISLEEIKKIPQKVIKIQRAYRDHHLMKPNHPFRIAKNAAMEARFHNEAQLVNLIQMDSNYWATPESLCHKCTMCATREMLINSWNNRELYKNTARYIKGDYKDFVEMVSKHKCKKEI